MRYVLFTFTFVFALVLSVSAEASSLSVKLKGRILLDVEQKGEAWYVNPTNEERYFLGRPADAFAIMRKLGLGITNADLDKIPTSDEEGESALAVKLAGRILLQVELKGEAWYVHPVTFKRYFLARPADAFRVMRELSLGITHDNLLRVPAAEFDAILLPSQAKAPAMQEKKEMMMDSNEEKDTKQGPDEKGTTEDAETATSTDTTEKQAVPPPSVFYDGDVFAPSSVTIKVGQTITFKNTGSDPMWVASDPHPVHTNFSAFDQRTSTAEYSFTFEKTGTYRYHNHLSPSDRGTVIVE